MSAVAFDTYAAVKTLREAGAAVGAGHDALATKADLADMKADIAELRASTKAEIAELRASMKADLAELRASTTAELRAAIDPLASKDDLAAAIASVRGEFGIIRWAVGLNVAFLFVVVVRVFGLI